MACPTHCSRCTEHTLSAGCCSCGFARGNDSAPSQARMVRTCARFTVAAKNNAGAAHSFQHTSCNASVVAATHLLVNAGGVVGEGRFIFRVLSKIFVGVHVN